MLRAVAPISETILLVDPGRTLTLLAVVWGYFDGSRGRGIVAVDGYISPADAWDVQFAPAWRKMLADPTWPGGRVQELKASDCRTGYGEFSGANGWTQADRKQLMIRAVKVITADTPLEIPNAPWLAPAPAPSPALGTAVSAARRCARPDRAR